jgi:O-glycosyl hydrolase
MKVQYWPVRSSYLVVGSFLIASFLGCSKSSPVTDKTESSNNEVIIDINSRQQTIRNFGASDAWSCQYIGLWPDEKRNQVADWLFSREEDASGNPKGIGLSLWRFNIGAGSAAQTNISDEWRRAEGFLKDDLTYDWTKQQGQRWFMNAAKQRGVQQFVGFTNSPPVQLTKNGKAFSSNGEEANIASDKYVSFANFLVDVSKKFNDDGIPFSYLSPFNEPQWDWTGNGQEGTPYKNTEIYSVTRVLDSLLTKNSMSLKIQIAEAGKLNYLYEKADKPTRGEQIQTFFGEGSALYVGNMPNVDHMISGHSYFTSSPDGLMKTIRENVRLHKSQASIPLEFWQSEYCILGDQEEVVAQGKDTGINPALYIARLIHHDLAVADASAWHWWLAVSVYDYKDGLIYADKNKTNGTVEDTKTLWALGNYSRFITPGSVRVAVTSGNRDVNNAKGAMISSYLVDAGKKLVTVVVNNSAADTSMRLTTTGGTVSSWMPYLTGPNADEKLKLLPAVSGDALIVIPKRSIVTLVGQLDM